MGSLNTKQLEYARCICIGRDGAICIDCKTNLSELKSVAHVDHKDGNKNNNPIDGSNWQMLCHSCNAIKWHKQKFQTVLSSGTKEFTMIVSSKMEYQWVKWLYASILKYKQVTKDYAVDTGALEVNGNPVTTLRYLKKHIGNMEIKGEIIVSEKALFRETFKDYDTFIKLSKAQEELLENNEGYE